MKKIIALAMTLMLVLFCVSALAENTIFIKDAFELKYGALPEGYDVTIMSDDPAHDYMAVFVKTDDPSAIGYTLTILFSDEWYGINSWTDATEDDRAAVEDSFYEVTELDPGDIIFSDYTTSKGIPIFTALEKNGEFGAVYTIYNSHEIELDYFPGEDKKLTVEDMDKVINFLENVEITPAA